MPSGQFDFEAEVRQNSYAAAGEGVGGHLRLNRRGELVGLDFITQASMDGRVFVANAGTLSSPATWTATAGIDITKPVLNIGVPSGTTIIPVEIVLLYETFGTIALMECMAAIGTGGIVGGTAVTPTNLRSDAPNTSTCSVYKLGTASTGPTVNLGEFWRDGRQKVITTGTIVAHFTPVCVGPAQLFICQGSQGGTGFCKFVYIEIPTPSVI
jgi:hypothetical protein